MPKKENVKLIVIIALIFILLGSASFLFSHQKTSEISPPTLEHIDTEKPSTELSVIDAHSNTETKIEKDLATLEIQGIKYQTTISKNTSVYSLMEKIQSEGKIHFKDTTYIGMGKFIEEINGVRSDGDRYWIYYVNNKKALIGVSNYKINPGDVVSWKFEKDTTP